MGTAAPSLPLSLDRRRRPETGADRRRGHGLRVGIGAVADDIAALRADVAKQTDCAPLAPVANHREGMGGDIGLQTGEAAPSTVTDYPRLHGS